MKKDWELELRPMNPNTCLSTDGYKLTQWLQRPWGLTDPSEYMETRYGGVHKDVVNIGHQANVLETMMRIPTEENIHRGNQRALHSFGTKEFFPELIWRKVMDLGYIPMRLEGLPEGSIVPEGVPTMRAVPTHDFFAPMCSHFECNQMWNWNPTATATRALYIYKSILPFFEETCEEAKKAMECAVNEFGLRGAGSESHAVMGGIGFLSVFKGSDNLPAMEGILDYYGEINSGLSLWATEHSVATLYGPGKGEYDYLNAQLDRCPDHLPFANVIDSYDADNYIKNVVSDSKIKAKIIAREGRTIFRPDSKDPIRNALKYLRDLETTFGSYENKKGYKVLNHNVGLIQGDGMNEESIPKIYEAIVSAGWSAENLATGAGLGILIDKLSRDRQRWAIKLHQAKINGVDTPCAKRPAGDLSKSSKEGEFKVARSKMTGRLHCYLKSSYTSVHEVKLYESLVDEMQVIFEDGELVNPVHWSEVRQRIQDQSHLFRMEKNNTISE